MNVFAVIVTYGNRYQLLERVVHQLLTLEVYKIVIVDNGSIAESRRALQHLARKNAARIELCSLDDNLGSAGGYKKGLEIACRHNECDFIWMLDDDNVPDQHALRSHLTVYRAIGAECCLVSLRKDRATYRNIRNETDVKRKFKPNNSFVHFSLRNLLLKRILYGFDSTRKDLIEIPYGPYGGMFIRKIVAQKIGPPHAELYLYMDDHEFSCRIVKAGLKIFLNRNSIVRDLEKSWSGNKRYWLFRRFMPAVTGDKRKAFYLLRNSAFLEKKHFITNRFEYSLNGFLYRIIFFSLCVVMGRRDRIDLFRKAIKEGRTMT